MGAAGWGPRSLFLRGLAAAFLAAFASLYLQIPGLYGRNGILPARRVLRPSGKGLWEQLWDVPTLLWLGPHLGLDTEQGMELLCLLGTLGAFCALAWESLRSCLIFALLWIFYLSLYQVGQVFLYFQWDSLLLEAGFLGVLVAPLLPRGPGGVSSCSPHEPILLWLPRWLLFRLMFASGVVKLSSRCPAWWGLTALTHHFQSQCLPTPPAWLAHHLPLWLHKLGVVATFAIEIALPPLFFLPLRRLRLFAFYCQVLLQVLIILTGNYNFFNLLTLALACSLLDHRPPGGGQPPSTRPPPPAPRPSPPALGPFLLGLLELCLGGSLLCWGGRCFGLAIDWDKWIIDSRVAFTYHEFSGWLRAVTLPLAGVALLSLCWEILLGLYRCLHTRGCWGKLWATLQWALVVTATLGVFTVSLVPYTQMDPESGGRLWPGARRLFGAVERFQVVNSYGLFRRMTGLGGRPEVVLEGTQDGQNWREIEFMYKPGNLSVAPPVVTPHQPRLDWQMWFAALGPPSSSPWLFSLVNRLLQGQEEVEVLVQQDQSQYPFSDRPPRLIRAQLYRYWFTPPGPNSPPGAWWVRQHVQEFLPPLALGDPTLETFLGQHRLQDKLPPRPPPAAPLPLLLQRLRRLSRPCSGPALIWSLYLVAATLCLLPAPGHRPRGGPSPPAPHRAAPRERGAPQRNGEAGREERGGEGRPRGGNEGRAEGQRGAKRKK